MSLERALDELEARIHAFTERLAVLEREAEDRPPCPHGARGRSNPRRERTAGAGLGEAGAAPVFARLRPGAHSQASRRAVRGRGRPAQAGARKEGVVSLTPDDPRHGTSNGYTNLKCRCQPCRDAWAAYFATRKLRMRMRLLGVDVPQTTKHKRVEPTHGSPSTYRNWGCRCDSCRRASTETRRDQKRRAKESAWTFGCRAEGPSGGTAPPPLRAPLRDGRGQTETGGRPPASEPVRAARQMRAPVIPLLKGAVNG